MAKTKVVEVVADKKVATVEKKVHQIETIVEALVITDQATYDKASEYLLLAKKGQQEAIDALDPQRAAAWETYQIALKQLNKYKDPFVNAEKVIKGKMSEYLLEQNRLREEKERELAEAAEKAAAKERERLAKKAEKLAKKGKVDEAEEVLEQAESVIAYVPQMTTSVMQTEGVGSRLADKTSITDMAKFIKAVADGTVKVDVDKLFTVKTAVLDQYIKLTGVRSIPGVTIAKMAIISAAKGGK